MKEESGIEIVGLVGSARSHGNTSTLVADALKAAEKMGARTRLITLPQLRIEGCRGCESCARDHRCVIDDDMQDLYPLLLRADGLVLGSPVYFYNVTAAVKAFIERCYCLEAFDDSDRSCWVGVREASGGGYAVVLTVGEQHEEQYLGFAAEAMSRSLVDLGYRVVAVVKACGLWAPGDAARDMTARSDAARAGERLVKIIKLRRALTKKLSVDGNDE